jgi:hypothetical protein
MLDIVLAVLNSVTAITMAGLGVHVSLHPTTSPEQKRLYTWAFYGCAVLSVALIGVQTYRNSTIQTALDGKLDKIDRNTTTPSQVINNIPAPQVVFERAVPPLEKSKIKPSVSYDIRPTDKPTHNTIIVTAEGDIERPAFKVTCESWCGLSSGSYPNGYTRYEIPATQQGSTVALIRFVMPAVIKSGEQVILEVGSIGEQFIKVKSVQIVDRETWRAK